MFFRRKAKSTAAFGIPSEWPRRHLRRRPMGRTLHRPYAPINASNTPKPRVTSTDSRWKKIKKIILLGGIAGITGWITYFLLISETLAIQTIQVQEDEKIMAEHPLEDLFQKFKGSNLLLVKIDDLETYLARRYTQYESVSIRKNFPHTLTLILKNYAIVANLTVEDTIKKETPWLLNGHGNLVKGSHEKDLPLIKMQTASPISEGLEVISQDHLAFMLEAMQNYEDKLGMKISYTLYLPIEREAHLWTEREFYVWLDMTMDLDKQLNKLKRVLSELNIYEESLEYIDLRISGVNGEKVIFKRK